MKGKIESTRSILDELVAKDNTKLCEGKILEVSMQLDELITTYYEERSKLNLERRLLTYIKCQQLFCFSKRIFQICVELYS